jgi:hypothetical protein
MVRRSLFLTALSAATVIAGTAAPAYGTGTPTQTRIDVIATGLDNPRGLTVLDDDVVLVTEAGRGGTGPCAPGGQNETWCLGATGAVTKVWRGHQRRVATGLPSIIAPTTGETLGPHDILLTSSGALVTIGLGADPALRPPFGPGGRLLAHLVRLTSHGARSVADLGAYEATANPDQGQPGTGPDSNPYGLARGPAGSVLVTDAGGNDVVSVDRRGRVSTVVVFPTTPTPAPVPGGVVPMHFVPTTVVRGPDNALYVGQLTGFPFPPGGARVWRVVPGSAPTVYAEGFTNIIDIAFDRRGRLLVLEISHNGLLSGDPTGALVRLERDGSRTDLAGTRLKSPTSVGVGEDGSLYVSNLGTSIGTGEVLRVRPGR